MNGKHLEHLWNVIRKIN